LIDYKEFDFEPSRRARTARVTALSSYSVETGSTGTPVQITVYFYRDITVPWSLCPLPPGASGPPSLC
jgi:hypothetical protein